MNIEPINEVINLQLNRINENINELKEEIKDLKNKNNYYDASQYSTIYEYLKNNKIKSTSEDRSLISFECVRNKVERGIPIPSEFYGEFKTYKIDALKKIIEGYFNICIK